MFFFTNTTNGLDGQSHITENTAVQLSRDPKPKFRSLVAGLDDYNRSTRRGLTQSDTLQGKIVAES